MAIGGLSVRSRCTGAILAGGHSARMGGAPKGLERVGADRMLDRVAAALSGAADELILVANDAEAADWLSAVPVVRDARPGAGALSGIHAALAHTGGDVVVLSWDAPFVPSGLLRALRETGELHDADVVVPSSGSEWGFEPLCAWYGASALPAIERKLDAGDFRVGALENDLAVLRLDSSAWGSAATLFCNVNTLEDLMRAQQLLATAVPE